MLIKPFRGLRPRADLSTKIPSYPYDVVNSEEARELVQDDPFSFLHVIKPEIDLDPGIDPHDDRVYARGRENLQSMIEQGWFVRESRPAYYIYQLVMDGQSQTGILGASAVQDYLENRIKKHEHTRPDKEEDRVRLNDALSVHPGPVFLTYRTLPEINAVVAGVVTTEADVDFTAPDDIIHRLWVVDDPTRVEKIETLLAQVRETYVADGHHRAAAAARVGAIRSEREAGGAGAAAYFMTALFPSDQIRVLDYNRVVRDLNGLEPATLVERVEKAGFQVKSGHGAKRPLGRGSFGMYLAGEWYLLTAASQDTPETDPLTQLDISILTRAVLQPILGIGDQRTDPRIDFVGGIRGMEELERRVDSGRDAVAFALHPTSLDEVMRVADSGQVMPPKSTWFEPKLRSGMVVQPLDGQEL